MVFNLCLMASQVYPPGAVLHQEQAVGRVTQDYQTLLPCHGTRHEIMRLGPLSLKPHESEEPWKPLSVFSESKRHIKIDPTLKKHMHPDVQDACPGSLLFSFEIAEKCIRHEKILQFLRSGASEVDISLFTELMGLEALKVDAHQQPSTLLIYPSTELFAQKPLVNFVGDLVDSSRITVHPDGRVLFNGTGTEMKDLLSVVAEFYLAKNSSKWKKQSMLVPHFTRLESSGVIIGGSSITLQATTVAPLKSPEKAKVKSLPKKKNGKRVGRERDLYKKNYFHACESLLSLMVDKKKRGKTAYLSLKKSGPELPELLTQFLLVLLGLAWLSFSLLPANTGLGFGLVWLSWAVNKLRDSIVYISKNGGKLGLNEDEMMQRVDSSVKEINFRAATLMAMAMLRLA
ncbi:hypothetical protein FNV43_RR23431 [Rhamnella rubrinervis]|uniref:Uncharacterized protein n=1 Tax=Rhamnella rubrinervis TaxID=2594499 RepID=A0A8K0DYI1_9ROSA|nr:hypothetical protein FNV43_RR23431 [Rhamnella rubrinervis]